MEIDMFYGNGYMAGMHGMWWFFWLLLVLVIWLTRGERLSDISRRSRESPHEVLQRRLAAGEITPEQYETCKKLLDRDAA